MAGAQGEAGVGDVGFDEHGAGRLVEGVGEAGDFGFNGVAGDALEGDPDGLADFDFDGLEFGQRDGGADDLEVGDRDERGRGRCAARGRGGDVGTHVGVAGGDDAGEGRGDLREREERFGAGLIGAGDFGAAAGGVEGERGDEVGGFGGGGFEAGELGGGDVDLGAGAGEVGEELGDLELGERLAGGDGVAFVDGDFAEVATDFGVEGHLLVGLERAGDGHVANDVAADGAGEFDLGGRGGGVERGGDGGGESEDEREERETHGGFIF